MTKGKKFKRRVLERIAETGESYQLAHSRLQLARPVYWCPERLEMHLRDGWVIAAESWPNDAGDIFWDVRAEHPDGTRIPPNHNWHETPPTLEMFRLGKVIG